MYRHACEHMPDFPVLSGLVAHFKWEYTLKWNDLLLTCCWQGEIYSMIECPSPIRTEATAKNKHEHSLPPLYYIVTSRRKAT
jgi:hypothetical protein